MKRQKKSHPDNIIATAGNKDYLLDVLYNQIPNHEKGHVLGYHFHHYTPYTNGYDSNDEVRFMIQNKDTFAVPSESSIIIEGKVLKTDANERTPSNLINNAYAFLFSEIRYEINEVIVDSVRHPGIASTMKHLPLLSAEERRLLHYAAWTPEEKLETANHELIAADGSFVAYVPLRLLLPFADDHRRIVAGVKHELILTRARTDYDSLLSSEEGPPTSSKYEIYRIVWRMPHANLSDLGKLHMYNILNGNTPIPMKFTRCELHESPNLSLTTRHEWTVKTSSGMEQPKYITFALQTNRRNNLKKNPSEFDMCELRTVKLFINDQFFPYHDLRIDWNGGAHIPELYEMFKNFENSYLDRQPISAITHNGVKNICPFVIFDLSRREESTIASSSDIKVFFECKSNVAPDTSAFCLIFYERHMDYHPITEVVRKV